MAEKLPSGGGTMKLTEIPVEGYEKVVRCDDPTSGLKAFISVHNTTLGPALGGVRMWSYASEQQACSDANRLAKSMTYKSAMADTGLGGGKAAIIGNPQTDKSERLLRSLGRFIDALDSLYIAAEDVGITIDDLCIVRQETRFVTGLPRGLGSSGNPAPFTALGVFLGMRACVERQLGTDDVTGMRVAVQGCGNVARHLCKYLHDAGAVLIVTDIAAEKAQEVAEQYAARLVAPETIYDVECEVYAPCALGGILNDDTLPRLSCQIIAGSANNQCLAIEHGDHLRQRGILYAPDFVINAGGVINIAVELEPEGYNEARARARVGNIYNTVHAVLEMAERKDMATNRAAMLLAKRKLEGERQCREGMLANGAMSFRPRSSMPGARFSTEK
jgi:leucine dehydrogenase